METLAFIHAHMGYEDTSPSPDMRPLDGIRSAISTSARAGLIGGTALTIVVAASEAQAVVQRGDTCAAVSSVQSALQARGFSTGSVDGSFGGQTEFAVLQFQRRNGLGADGVVGPTTAQALGLDPNISCGTSTSPGTSTSTGTPAPANATYRVSSSSGLNVRSGPGDGYAVIGSLADGAVVQAGTALNNGYRQLSTGGWVSNQYLVAPGTGTTSTPGTSGGGGGTATTGSYRVSSSSGLNVRSGPGAGYAVVGGLANGAVVQAGTALNNGYRQLSTGGWVSNQYLVAPGTGTATGGTGSTTSGGGGGGGAPNRTVRINTNSRSLNVRSGPGSGYSVVGTLANGTAVQATGRTVGEWLELANGRWISSRWADRV